MDIAYLMSRAPLIAFIVYRLMYRGEITDLVWRDAFILSGSIALAVYAFILYKGKFVNRIWLGPNIFFMVGAVAFLFEITPILVFYHTYKGLSFLSGIFFAGLITTFFSPLGFFGVANKDEKTVRKASLQMLGVIVIAMIWSYITNDYGLHVSAVLPFIVIRVVSSIVEKQFGK